MVLLTKNKIVPEKLIRFVRSKKYGGIALFLGEVRDQSSNNHKIKKVIRLDYSAYYQMALKEMKQIQKEILRKWGGGGKEIGKVAMVHRLGKLKVGETSVAIAVSAPHRREAFEVCRYAIDQIKKRVPIFKKEFFADGQSLWVGCSRC